MLLLSETNSIIDTDVLTKTAHFGVLSFSDFKNPDFFFRQITSLYQYQASAQTLIIGNYTIVVPMHWSILCTDIEYVQFIPLVEISGLENQVLAMNPINGFVPEFLPLRMGKPFPNATWTCPPVDERDTILIPLHTPVDDKRGPLCVIFACNKLDMTRPLADILSDI